MSNDANPMRNWLQNPDGTVSLTPLTDFDLILGNDTVIALQLQAPLPDDLAPVPGATGILVQTMLSPELAEEMGRALLRIAKAAKKNEKRKS